MSTISAPPDRPAGRVERGTELPAAPRSKNESGVRLITAMIPNEPVATPARRAGASADRRPAGGLSPVEAIAPASFGKNL